MPLPEISPDARRRRLIDLLTRLSLARRHPAIYVIEDVHWIDSVSESMLVDILVAVSKVRATMLITYRPEYIGPLSRIAGTEPIVLAPLHNSHISEMLSELLGEDSSVVRLAGVVAARAAGVPFLSRRSFATWPSAARSRVIVAAISASGRCRTIESRPLCRPRLVPASIGSHPALSGR